MNSCQLHDALMFLAYPVFWSGWRIEQIAAAPPPHLFSTACGAHASVAMAAISSQHRRPDCEEDDGGAKETFRTDVVYTVAVRSHAFSVISYFAYYCSRLRWSFRPPFRPPAPVSASLYATLPLLLHIPLSCLILARLWRRKGTHPVDETGRTPPVALCILSGLVAGKIRRRSAMDSFCNIFSDIVH